MSVCLSHSAIVLKRCKLDRKVFTGDCHVIDSSFLWQYIVPLGEDIRLEIGRRKGITPQKFIILPLSTRLA